MPALIIEILSLASRAYNVIFLGGVADMTTSARAYAEPLPRHLKVIDGFFAFFGHPDHCRRWHEEDLRRADLLLKDKLITREDAQ